MKYQPPVNSMPTDADPEPVYVDGNPQAAVKGSIPPAKAVEHPMREVVNVIKAAGLTPDESDLSQLLQAIKLIAAGAGAVTAVFAFNPVYPDVLSNGGVMSVAASNGQVTLATGQQWVHRGGVLYDSSSLSAAARTLATVPSKTYHMRWRYNGGAPTLALYDLADGIYNPGAKPETHADFDTGYDDMLIARVVTNAANTPTVTALLNRSRLLGEVLSEGEVTEGPASNTAERTAALAWNWSRKPQVGIYPTAIDTAPRLGGGTFAASDVHDHDLVIDVQNPSRYGASVRFKRDYATRINFKAQIAA